MSTTAKEIANTLRSAKSKPMNWKVDVLRSSFAGNLTVWQTENGFNVNSEGYARSKMLVVTSPTADSKPS